MSYSSHLSDHQCVDRPQSSPLYTKYQDAEVRAARLSDAQGRIYAIGIEPPDGAGRIKIRANAWDFNSFLHNPRSLCGPTWGSELGSELLFLADRKGRG
jgi:hypothetical protein